MKAIRRLSFQISSQKKAFTFYISHVSNKVRDHSALLLVLSGVRSCTCPETRFFRFCSRSGRFLTVCFGCFLNQKISFSKRERKRFQLIQKIKSANLHFWREVAALPTQGHSRKHNLKYEDSKSHKSTFFVRNSEKF